MRIVYIILAGFVGYQLGKKMSYDPKEEYVISKTQILGNGLGNVEYLKIDNNGGISFVSDETMATKFNSYSAQNAMKFLKDVSSYSSPYKINILPIQQISNVQSV